MGKTLLSLKTLYLTLRLMARAARSKNWTLRELQDHLKKHEPLIWNEEGRNVRLSQIYHQLYSLTDIPPEWHMIAELFTLLPSGSYTQAFLTGTFPEIFHSGPELQEILDRLTGSGWLNHGSSGYSMHPLVAQCLRRRVITQKTLEPMIPGLHRGVHGTDPDSVRIREILLYTAKLLSGPVDRELMSDILSATRHLVLTFKEKEHFADLLNRLSKQCRGWDPIYLQMVAKDGTSSDRVKLELKMADSEAMHKIHRPYKHSGM